MYGPYLVVICKTLGLYARACAIAAIAHAYCHDKLFKRCVQFVNACSLFMHLASILGPKVGFKCLVNASWHIRLCGLYFLIPWQISQNI